ncbi:ArsR/SmtB family transcription factor [Luteipulveratus mongoliensis]|uniref:ArsR/SmtB family transcription factor n=1 Tax=Luteipulveratus mongoliensis TaxID=571913 RepID=UPI0012EE4F13|nr:helix-turn-helix domain-containing protein [Luteipulveratus mongoliensis]
MVVRIEMSQERLRRSRFALSPAFEMVGTLRAHGMSAPPPHLAERLDRARQLMPEHLNLLTDLVPALAGYAADFLTPLPDRFEATADQVCEAIAMTPVETISYQLDIGFRGRQVHPHVRAVFASASAYDAWRHPLPESVRRLLASGGPRAVAHAAAEAAAAYLDVVIGPDWPQVRSLLQDDITYRVDRMAAHGPQALLEDLGDEVHLDPDALVLDRPYDLLVCWAGDGLLMVPSASHQGPVQFIAEEPDTPVVIYGARGTGALWEAPPAHDDALADLVGQTRAVLLERLIEPTSTARLSRECGWSEANVSYHLGILLRAGLVEKRRRGRLVHYRRTALGTGLAAARSGRSDVGRTATGG